MRFSIKYECGHTIEITDPKKFTVIFGARKEGKQEQQRLCDYCQNKRKQDAQTH